MKYLLSLVFVVGVFVSSFAIAENEFDLVPMTEKELRWMYYNGEDSNWLYLDDTSHKKGKSIQYFDKAGQQVKTLSLRDMDKVLVKKNSREEVVLIQMYNEASATNEKDLELQPKVVDSELEEAKSITEDKPLYKENGVWKN